MQAYFQLMKNIFSYLLVILEFYLHNKQVDYSTALINV